MNRGYVKIYRCIEDNVIWQSDEPYSKRAAWIDLILQANHKDSSFILGMQSITVKRGQKWTSIGKLCERWHWGREKVSRYLNLLENNGMIWQERTNRGLLITLVNYTKFQDFSGDTRQQTKQQTRQPIEHQTNIKPNIKPDSKPNTNNNVNNDIKNDIKNESKNEKKPAAQFDFFVEE